MASRDNRGQGRTLKILSREDRDRDRDSDRWRDDTDRDRDNRRREDRDRDRRRDDRDRERRRDRDRDSESSKPVQGPIVLLKRPDAKPSATGKETSDRREQSLPTGDGSSKHGPTSILQRSSKKDAAETDQGSNAEKGKQSTASQITDILKPPYKFAGGQAITLIDSAMRLTSWKSFEYDSNNYLGNMDYLVVTAIGRPNVGKSTILSYLAGNDDIGTRKIFPPRNRDTEMHTSAFISPDQIVFIELSSVYNQAATNDFIPLVSQQGVLELSNMTWNLRLVRWALSISHVLLIISENVFEPTVFKLMNSSEIVHPMDSALGEGSYPEPIFICNKASLELLDKTDVTQEFQKHFTSVTGRTPRIPSNYFVLPHTKYEMEHYRFENFKTALMDFSRYNRAPFTPDENGLAKLVQKHSIQDWYQNASRLWDEFNLPNYFNNYVKLLP